MRCWFHSVPSVAVCDAQLKRQADFAVQQHVVQLDGIEPAVGEDPFRAARQAFAETGVAGVFVLRPVVGGHAVIPAAVPGHGDRVVLAIKTVGLFAVQYSFTSAVGVGVLRIARVEVALAAVAGLKLQRLHRGKVPAHHAVDIFVNRTFTACRVAAGVGAGACCLVALVDVPCVGLGFGQVAIHAEADVAAQRAVQAEVGAFGGTFRFVLRRVEVGVPGTVPLLIAVSFLVMMFTTPPAAPLP